ncbi:MAG: phytanoyl-CoA dioxygenase family protein [Planctomycetaceae bacterium]|nr:phytanoyl-CoA dioxygenase family protein [Planctomycetaceae bacterium]
MNCCEQLASDGYAVVPGVYRVEECREIASQIESALVACHDGSASLRRANGAIYGARNLLDLFPEASQLWQRSVLTDLLSDVLGSTFGLVRGLFFDKPPRGSWSLPWHRDLTIAVHEHQPASDRFRNPTTKAGVPHVEAPDEILRQMLTLRIHLDAATAENGPLVVVPGSHHSRDTHSSREPAVILAAAGDVLAMRPLLEHSSGESHAGSDLHRRVVHLEFAASPALPDGYRWRQFNSI